MSEEIHDKTPENASQERLASIAEEVKPSLGIINEKHDPTVWEKINSHRSQYGSLIVFVKEIFESTRKVNLVGKVTFEIFRKR